jgi:hypothetical protein
LAEKALEMERFLFSPARISCFLRWFGGIFGFDCYREMEPTLKNGEIPVLALHHILIRLA